jgi:hypothetical protein
MKYLLIMFVIDVALSIYAYNNYYYVIIFGSHW